TGPRPKPETGCLLVFVSTSKANPFRGLTDARPFTLQHGAVASGCWPRLKTCETAAMSGRPTGLAACGSRCRPSASEACALLRNHAQTAGPGVVVTHGGVIESLTGLVAVLGD